MRKRNKYLRKLRQRFELGNKLKFDKNLSKKEEEKIKLKLGLLDIEIDQLEKELRDKTPPTAGQKIRIKK